MNLIVELERPNQLECSLMHCIPVFWTCQRFHIWMKRKKMAKMMSPLIPRPVLICPTPTEMPEKSLYQVEETPKSLTTASFEVARIYIFLTFRCCFFANIEHDFLLRNIGLSGLEIPSLTHDSPCHGLCRLFWKSRNHGVRSFQPTFFHFTPYCNYSEASRPN